MIRMDSLLKSPIHKHPPVKLSGRIVKPYISKGYGVPEYNFTMYDLKTSQELGTLICFPERIYRKDVGSVQSLYVAYLSAEKHSGQGVGSALLNIAKKYSHETNCGGFVHLESTGRLSPFRIPHVFYRKKGMSTISSKIDKRLDKFIKDGKDAIYEDFPLLRMYYPPINENVLPKDSILKKYIERAKIFFHNNISMFYKLK